MKLRNSGVDSLQISRERDVATPTQLLNRPVEGRTRAEHATGTIAPANGGDTAEQNESMSRVRVRWQACVPASKQNHQGRVTGRRSESSLPARAGTAPGAHEEKLPGTTVILVAVPGRFRVDILLLCHSRGHVQTRVIPPGQVARPTFPLLPRFVCVPPTSADQLDDLSFSFGLVHWHKLVV
ncbi:hypothetical protein K0M31_018153 [Melipona bicolor]|uniref:Uncharacterized protein n=1 Tax=Melipona bicolor TaxID=60889 RepID=A0AA40FD20_9HYME|nr:hypothetical protein K0M31_018153 [Melipona bicolor]